MPMPRLGAEELYRSPDYRDTLDLLERQTQRNIQQKGNIGTMGAEEVAARGQDFGKMISDIPTNLQTGAEYTRRAQKHQADMDKEALGAEEGKVRLETSRSAMEDANRRRNYLTGQSETAPGKTREEELWGNEVKDAQQDRELKRVQIQESIKRMNQMTAEYQGTVKGKNIDKVSMLLQDAIKRGDQNAILAAQQQGRKLGLTDFDLQVADAAARSGVSSAEAAQNITYDSSVPGQLANEQLVNASTKLQQLPNLSAKMNEYKTAMPGSPEEDSAFQDVKALLTSMGVDTAPLESRIGVSNWQLKSRSGRMDDVKAQVRGAIMRDINTLKATTGGTASPRIRQQIQQLESALQQFNTNESAKTNIFNGAKGPAAPTQILNALSGAAPAPTFQPGALSPASGAPGAPQQTSRFRGAQKR